MIEGIIVLSVLTAGFLIYMGTRKPKIKVWDSQHKWHDAEIARLKEELNKIKSDAETTP